MLVLHAVWSPHEGIGVWAEDTLRPVQSASRASRTARAHPFAAPVDTLTALLPGSPSSAVAQLPALRGAPLDSPELVRVKPRSAARSEPTLLPWTVPVVRLDPATALQTLGSSDEADVEARYGASVRFFAEVASFARALVAHGRILPSLSRQDSGPIAWWRPVLRGQDRRRFESLADAIPPACRAEDAETNPRTLVRTALSDLVNAEQRQRLEGVALLPNKGARAKRASAFESWLRALSDETGRFEATTSQLDVVENALSAWEEIGTDGPEDVHATFRLTDSLSAQEAAEGVDPAWRVEFLVQSAHDPSLLVSAEQVWDGRTGPERWLQRPQELLLAELGRASRICPALKPALDERRPRALELDTDGAYQFLSGAAELLHDAGFGVLLPTWWERTGRLGLALSASSSHTDTVAATGKFGQDALVDFRWQLAVGDEVLTETEIAALAEAKAPLVRLRGQWVAVDQQQLQRGLDFLSRTPEETVSPGEFLRLAASGRDDTEAPLPVTTVRADGWLGDLLDGSAEHTVRPVRAPDSVQATLRPYQRRGLSWLSFLSSVGLGACLADDMGLGKTLQLLSLEAAERNDGSGLAPTLLICPMSVVGNWQREAEKFTPDMRVYAHHGSARLRDELPDKLGETDLVVTTYSTATRDIDTLAALGWHRVVLDEAQAVKNSKSKSSGAVRSIPSRQRIALTGTPLENRLSELWSIMEFLNPGLLGSAQQFRTRYAIPVERDGQSEPAERLRGITRPFVLRRLKTDPDIITDLPEKIEVKQYYRLSTEQASLYQAVVDDMLGKIEGSEGIERRGNVLAAMAKLKQVCNHPAQLLHDNSTVGTRSGKVGRLIEVLAEVVAEGDKTLCFTQFTEFAEMLLPHLATHFGVDVLYLHGGTPKKRRDELVERFQSAEGPAIFLLSLKAGGTGLNLTAANHVLHLDRWWNPAVEDQATDRAFRIGQKRNVQVRKFVCAGTVEERIDTMIEDKKALANMVVSDGEKWLTELSTSNLREMFTLSEGAVDE